MFPAMYTHYYWEEKREEIYRSAPTRSRVSRGRRGGARRARRTAERQESAECLSHGPTWAAHYDQLMEGLCGRVLPDRPHLRQELALTVCSCDDRDKEKCREAAARFGFIAGSNLPPLELNDRMRFTELYFHNILNSPQFTTEYKESAHLEDPLHDIVQGLHAARSAIFALVQRCVLANDLKAYRLLDIVRLYIQKPCAGSVHLPLPAQEEAALEMLFSLEKGDHMSTVAKLFGCQVTLGLSADCTPPTLDLSLATANLDDIKGVEEYFQEPLGYKEPPPKPEPVAEDPSPAEAPPGEAAGDQPDGQGPEEAQGTSQSEDSVSEPQSEQQSDQQPEQAEAESQPERAPTEQSGTGTEAAPQPAPAADPVQSGSVAGTNSEQPEGSSSDVAPVTVQTATIEQSGDPVPETPTETAQAQANATQQDQASTSVGSVSETAPDTTSNSGSGQLTQAPGPSQEGHGSNLPMSGPSLDQNSISQTSSTSSEQGGQTMQMNGTSPVSSTSSEIVTQ